MVTINLFILLIHNWLHIWTGAQSAKFDKHMGVKTVSIDTEIKFSSLDEEVYKGKLNNLYLEKASG